MSPCPLPGWPCFPGKGDHGSHRAKPAIRWSGARLRRQGREAAVGWPGQGLTPKAAAEPPGKGSGQGTPGRVRVTAKVPAGATACSPVRLDTKDRDSVSDEPRKQGQVMDPLLSHREEPGFCSNGHGSHFSTGMGFRTSGTESQNRRVERLTGEMSSMAVTAQMPLQGPRRWRLLQPCHGWHLRCPQAPVSPWEC